MWEIRCQRVLCCNGRQPPHACGVLTHLQAGGLGQARKGWADARRVLATTSRDHTRSTGCVSKSGVIWSMLAICRANTGVAPS